MVNCFIKLSSLNRPNMVKANEANNMITIRGKPKSGRSWKVVQTKR